MKKSGIWIVSLLYSMSSFSQLTPTEDDIMIPMSDGKFLEADVYIPSGCTSCEVVLVQTPYNKDLFEWSLPMGIGQNVDDQPFIWVIVDWRGFYGSVAATVSSPDRGQDAFDICEWIVDQPWHNNRIATWGPSALGNIQYQLIAKHHPNHTCAIPVVASPQFAYTGYFYGGALEEARLEQLDALGYGLSTIVMANVYYNTTWQYAESQTYYPDDIEIPTLQIGGWYDHNIDEVMQFYKDSRNEASSGVQDQQWLLIGPWVHGGTGIAYVGSSTQGELSYPDAEFDNDSLAWKFLKFYLLDSLNGWLDHPKITYYELGKNQWHYSNNDDIAIANDEVLFLNSSARLTHENGTGFTAFISDPADPSPTIGGATLHPDLEQGPYDQTYLDGRDDIITFQTDSLSDDLSVTGKITVKLFISSTSADCDLVIRLVDVYPDGTNMLITDGIQRVRFRNGYTIADEELMIPGEIYEVDVELPFTNYTWLTGHRLKIYVGGNSSIRWNVNLQDGLAMYTTATPVTATISIHHDNSNASRIILPTNNTWVSNQELNHVNSTKIFPNPTSSQLNILAESSFNHYQIFDFSGRLMMDSKLVTPVDVSNLVPGIYVLKLISENGNISEHKFVVK